MARRALADWLRWQESLHPRSIDLGLDRVRAVGARLGCLDPSVPVFTVAGTNGKGTTVAMIEGLLLRSGRRTGVYTSPHLVTYNERIRVAGRPAGDDDLVAAFERLDEVRGDVPLTFFEFGTLSAFEVFCAQGCDALVLEVGMGGRLDAVNVLDADYAVITTVALDHTEYLGDTIEKIAAEKAGILRPSRPAFFGDWPIPAAVDRTAATLGAPLRRLGADFDFTPSRPLWRWRGQSLALDALVWPAGAVAAQLRNVSVALAVLEQFDPRVVADSSAVNEVMAGCWPAGRCQVVRREHEWVLDVAHNPQAAATLRQQLDSLATAADTTVVIGILGDKSLDAFVAELGPLATRWVTCTVGDARARAGADIATQLRLAGARSVIEAGAPEEAFDRARADTPRGGRIVVCGSFRIVGPALRWLGIY
jgi:dihydrofolate synthase/folylpolyglutamate synthase